VPATALIVVDMLNTYDHPDAEKLMPSVEAVLPAVRDLVDRARRDGTRTIYVNDNQGPWTWSREELLQHALEGARPDLVEPIAPPDDAYFLVKARHTVFYGTPLEYLLGQEEIERLVLVGQVTEQCILYSALDAYVRHLHVTVPRDAVAHIHEDLAEAALRMMERNMQAEIADAAGVRFEARTSDARPTRGDGPG
jgi:nicotinamidase-related amidase